MFSFHSLNLSLIYIYIYAVIFHSLFSFIFLSLARNGREIVCEPIVVRLDLQKHLGDTLPPSPPPNTPGFLSPLSLPSCTPEPVVHTWPKECKCVADRCPTPKGAAKGADQYNKKRACVPGLCDGAWRKRRVCLLVHLRAVMFMWAVRVQGSRQRKCCASLYSSGAKERVWFFSFGGFFFFWSAVMCVLIFRTSTLLWPRNQCVFFLVLVPYTSTLLGRRRECVY